MQWSGGFIYLNIVQLPQNCTWVHHLSKCIQLHLVTYMQLQNIYS